jgi:hypothetical protein
MTPAEKKEYDETQTELMAQQKPRKIGFPNPLLSFMILLERDAFMIIFYVALMMFGSMVMMTSLPSLYPAYYGLDELQVGLCFLYAPPPLLLLFILPPYTFIFEARTDMRQTIRNILRPRRNHKRQTARHQLQTHRQTAQLQHRP